MCGCVWVVCHYFRMLKPEEGLGVKNSTYLRATHYQPTTCDILIVLRRDNEDFHSQFQSSVIVHLEILMLAKYFFLKKSPSLRDLRCA